MSPCSGRPSTTSGTKPGSTSESPSPPFPHRRSSVSGVDSLFSPKPRFIVRDFQYNEVEMKADKEEMTRLSTDKKKQFVGVWPRPCAEPTIEKLLL